MGLNESAGKREPIMMHLNIHLPPPLPCRTLFAHTGSSPSLPPSASSLPCLVDSNHRVACNQPDAVERHLLDPDPVIIG